MAGRLVELPEGELVVDCTAEGVVFVEADADTGLEELGQPLLPPYPCVEEHLCDPGDTQVVVGKPLVFLQVTRLKHEAFVLGLHICHSLCDGFGVFKFIKALCDIASGETAPAVIPLWGRELFTSSLAPRITRTHLPYEPLAGATAAADVDVVQSTPPQDMVGRYFFGPAEISALRSHLIPVPSQQQLSRGPVPAATTTRPTTAFELLAAATWKCRTAALGYAPDERVRLMFTCNSRRSWKRDPPVPEGFYGCAVVLTVAETTAGDLRGVPLGGAVELVRRAKFDVCDEYVRSTADLLAARRWPPFVVDRTYVVSDITAVGEEKLDFGWAKRAGGGVPLAGDALSKLVSYFMRCKNAQGEDCVAVPMYLPRSAMDRFAQEISALLPGRSLSSLNTVS
ncbi:hypothetical protein BS78_02G071700 [Paspalum vaginatum]|nr:hypothetical protein BS78_02G071700 [Paspalum vaginatum]